MRVKFRYSELMLRTFKFTQDMIEKKWDCIWSVAGRESDECYKIPRVLND